MKKCTTSPCPYKDPYCPTEKPTCPNGHTHVRKRGFDKKGIQRFRCMECNKSFKIDYIYNFGTNNGMWKGGKVGYTSLHEWIRNRKPKPELCEECHEEEPYDLANVSGKYLRDINDYRWLCRKCHMKSDGRMNNLKQFQVNNMGELKKR